MYKYNICNQADEEIFFKQCMAIEKNIAKLTKHDLITDVDESMIQKYILKGKKIAVYNDYYVGAVYIKSEVDIAPYFN
ncbi:MAG: hypothetical protein ACLKAO_03825 [Alkaliphilus sp.]